MSASKRFTRLVWQDFRNAKGHDSNSFSHLVVKDAKPGKVRAEMVVKPHQTNRLSSLHGGLIASLVDTMGSLALSTRGLWLTGVSTDINITYVRSAKLGETLGIQSELINMGRTLAFTRTEITSLESGKLLAYGSHTKYIKDALKGERNVELSADGEQLVKGEWPVVNNEEQE
ncbi:PaaI family thioesterase [Sporobolomyces koalae]|uniref:PaaI family thioesterase n=1 Tax=Sporobolomyces koalae TaxID=500713 RepID=UPI003170187E